MVVGSMLILKLDLVKEVVDTSIMVLSEYKARGLGGVPIMVFFLLVFICGTHQKNPILRCKRNWW